MSFHLPSFTVLLHSQYVLVVLGLVCPRLPAGVGAGAGRLWRLPLLPRAWTARCPQVEQQEGPAPSTGGQRELHRRGHECPDMTGERRRRGGKPSVLQKCCKDTCRVRASTLTRGTESKTVYTKRIRPNYTLSFTSSL